jgi:rubrerythrin
MQTVGWTQLFTSGRVYWYNVNTGETRWQIEREGGPYNQQMQSAPPTRQRQSHHGYSTPQYYRGPGRHLLPHTHSSSVRSLHSYSFIGSTSSIPMYRTPSLSTQQHQRDRRRIKHSDDTHQRQLSEELRRITHANERIHHSSSILSPASTAKTKSRSLQNREVDERYNAIPNGNTLSKPNSILTDDNHIVELFPSTEAKTTESHARDYVGLSEDYNKLERYRFSSKTYNDTSRHLECVLCMRPKRIDKVFFPCEHKCICTLCLERSAPKNCPLCNDVVKLVLDDTDDANEMYWEWVEEVKPTISRYFLQQFFAESKSAIRSAMRKGIRHHSSTNSNSASTRRRKRHTPRHHVKHVDELEMQPSTGMFSCWQMLFVRRWPACAPELR